MPQGNEKDLQDQIFDMVRRSQEVILDASRNFVDGASDMAPGDREQIDRLIDNAFDLTERILQSQRDFAKTVLDSVTGPLGRSDPGGDADR
jgi:hypothetical protein